MATSFQKLPQIKWNSVEKHILHFLASLFTMYTNFKGGPKLLFSVVIPFGSFFQENPICRVYLLSYQGTIPFLCTALQWKHLGERVEVSMTKGAEKIKDKTARGRHDKENANPSYFREIPKSDTWIEMLLRST